MLARAFDVLDRRALAWLTFVDALGVRVRSPVAIAAEGVRWFAKRPGELVVTEAPGLCRVYRGVRGDPRNAAGHVATGPPAVRPGPGARAASPLRCRVIPTLRSRTGCSRPVSVPLLPTPLAQPTGLVAALRVTLRRADDQRRIEGALVRLRPDGGRPPALALTDAAGDALLLVPGVPLASPGAGAVVRPDLDAQLDAIVDPLLARFHPDAALDEARAAAARRTAGLIDPDDLLLRLAAQRDARAGGAHRGWPHPHRHSRLESLMTAAGEA